MTVSFSTQLYRIIGGFVEGNLIVILISGVVIVILATIAATTWIVRLSGWQSSIDKNLESGQTQLERFMEEIRNDIKAIFRALSPTTVTSSPVRLSELGEEIADEIEVQKWIKKYAENLRSRTEGKNSYEIQEACFSYARYALLAGSNEDTIELKNKMEMAAFNHGLQLKHVLEAVGVVLRDEVFKLIGISALPD